MAHKPEAPDKLDEAIDAVDLKPKEADTLVADLALPDGRKIRLIVPRVFDSDGFETAVGGLVQLRMASEQIQQAAAPQIVVPNHDLVTPDGRKLRVD